MALEALGLQALDLGTIMANLPMILGIVQIVMYVLISFFFGSIIIRGYRGFLPFWMKIPLMLVFGFLCLVVGSSLGAFIPVPSPFDAFWADIFIGIIITSIVFLIGLNIFSYRLPWLIDGFENRVNHFEKKISKLRSGEKLLFMTPMRIIGMVIFFGFLIFGLVTFSGLPSLTESMMSLTGIDMDTTSMSAECQAMTSSVYANLGALMNQDTTPTFYTNPTLQTAMEQGCGESILALAKYDLDTPVVIGITASGKLCLGTETEYCTSMDLSNMGLGI